ncbi:type VII secretion protein EccE [Micromonospora zhanjiangensis]|uniref:Type VII secretion protein EccE n=1 Tax=Micromonospora zhanjiangensis TaxID=1522057 RepID=A0ABV8KMG5_9ACTN
MSQRSAAAATVPTRPEGDAAADRTTTRGQSRPPILTPRRRPGHLGPIHVTQLLLIEAVLVAIAAISPYGLLAVVPVVLVSVVLLGVVLARRKGRWWLERRIMTRQFRRRQQGVAGATLGADPRLAALRALAPGLVVENVTTSDGARIGVARDDAGWYAVASVAPDSPVDDGPTTLPLEKLASTFVEADQPGAVLQLVTHTLPAPSIDTHPSSPAGHSYRQLLAQFGTVAVPADRATWLAVRLDARTLAQALGDDPADLEQAPAVTAALIRRVTKSLHRDGIAHRLLDADGLLAALARSCDLEPTGQPVEAVSPREEWTEWRSPRLAHRSYWVRGWPPVGQAGAVLGTLSGVPAAMTSVALILAQDDDNGLLDLRGLVRVAAPAGELAQTCHGLTRAAQQVRAELFQLDGEQGPAVYATAPTGGGAR